MSTIRTLSIVLLSLVATSTVTAATESAPNRGLDWPAVTGTTIWTSPTQPGWVPGSGGVLDFAADGTGVSYESLRAGQDLADTATVAESLTWSVTGGDLEIVYDDFSTVSFIGVGYPFDVFVDFYGFDQEVTDFLNQAFEDGLFNPPAGQVELTTITVSTTNTITSEANGRALASSTKRIEYSIDEVLISLNWPGPLPRGVQLDTSETLVYLPAAITNGLQSPPGMGDTWAVPTLYRPLDPRVTEESPQGWLIDVFTLEAGSTSAGLIGQESYAWSATADGLVLDDGSERYTYVPIETDGALYFALVTYTVNGVVELRSGQWIALGDGTGSTMIGDLVTPIPEYWQSGINLWIAEFYDESGQQLPSQVFGYSLANDGTSFRIFGGGENCLNDEFDPCFVSEAEFGSIWNWSAVGDTIVRNLTIPGLFNRERTWTVLRYEPGGRATVFEWGVWQFLPDPWYFAIPPRLTSLEVKALSDWPEEWADAQGFYPDDDADGDGIADAADSCVALASSDLRDTDGDGIGNVCDTDLNQDCQVNFEDLGVVKSVFFTTPGDSNWNPDADFNGDSAVNFTDLGIIKNQFFLPPGPSGVPNLCD
ncbi:MAG: dockerin type I domain-containing protein [Pseudomonadota bacterium]